jgi:hypothetical protein
MFRAGFKLKNVIVDDRLYSNALCKAIKKGDIEEARHYLKHSQAEPEQTRGKPLLNFAAEAEKSEMMALLIQHGASKWIPSIKGNMFVALALEIVTRRDIEGT